MSILSWILCYFGIGSEEGDIREEEREAREGKGSNKNRTSNKPDNNRSTRQKTQNRQAQRTESAPVRNQGKRNVTLVAADGDEIEFICYGIVGYRGKSYACMELIDSDDDGVLFFEYTVRGGEENYVIVEDDSLINKLLAEANKTLSK